MTGRRQSTKPSVPAQSNLSFINLLFVIRTIFNSSNQGTAGVGRDEAVRLQNGVAFP